MYRVFYSGHQSTYLLELNKDCIAKSIRFGPILTSNYYLLLQGSQMLGRHMCMLVMVHTGKYGRIVRLHGLWSFQPRVTKYKELPVFMDYILTNVTTNKVQYKVCTTTVSQFIFYQTLRYTQIILCQRLCQMNEIIISSSFI